MTAELFALTDAEMTACAAEMTARTGWAWAPDMAARTWSASPRPGVRAAVLPPVPCVPVWQVGVRAGGREEVRDLRPFGVAPVAVAGMAGVIARGMAADLAAAG
jgi:hypothetical protein